MKSVLIIFLKIGITALSIIKQKGVSLFNVTKYNKEHTNTPHVSY